MPKSKKVLAAVEDLFFVVKINDLARRAGLEVEFLKTEDDIVEQAELQQPLLVILDLNNNRIEPVGLISRLKGAAATKGISIISFVAHVQAELKQQAQEAGANMVLARSAFSASLPQIFKRHTGSL
ncbi:MAG TPA: response regulator [Bryobacteraceae bacterium]|nr:response regulator [Bryobacterales bacterium]HRJ18140.1 response regulator [Bryobacteraceae bacterium]